MKKNWVDKFILFFSLFIIGSVIGFAHENLFALIKGQEGIRRGLIYGPFIPVYGIGLLLFYYVYANVHLKTKKRIVKFIIVFIIGFVMGGFTEYICSYLQEVYMGTKSWDYADVMFNINGRTSLWHALFWGIMSVLFYKFVLPILYKTKKYLNNQVIKKIAFFIIICVVLDCTISIVACLRRTARRNNIVARNKIEEILDKYYPDEYLDKIYNNAKIVEK